MGEYEPDDSRVITGQSQARQEAANPRDGGIAPGTGNQAQQSATAPAFRGPAGAMPQSQGQQSQSQQTQGQQAQGQQAQGQQSQSGRSQQQGGQSMGGSMQMADPDTPEQNNFVDQQTASEGGYTAEEASMGGQRTGQQAAEQVGGGQRADSGQQSQSEDSAGGGQFAGQIREHMEVIGADGAHLGTVDAVEGHRIKLTKRDSGAGFEGGSHEGHHHYVPMGLVADVEGDRVRLSATGANAYAMLEEKDG